MTKAQRLVRSARRGVYRADLSELIDTYRFTLAALEQLQAKRRRKSVKGKK